MASITMAEGIQTNIEIMTRRLELEKRRLHRLEQELASSQRAYEQKSVQQRSRGSTQGRPCTAPRGCGSQLVDESVMSADGRPKSGRGARVLTPSKGRKAVSSVSSSHGGSDCQSPESSVPVGRGRSAHLPVEEYIRTPGEPGFGKDLLLPETGSTPTLANRLDVAVKKLDCVKYENGKLQGEVDQARRHRLQLNAIFDRLKAEIRQRNSQLSDVNEDMNAGLVVQNEAQQRISVMKKQRESDRARFKDQVLKIRMDLKDYDFEKKEVEVKLKRAQDGVQKKRGLIMPPEESDFSETAMMRRIMKTAFLNCIQRRHIKQHEKTIAVFEQAFATIKQSTGISNIDEIVKIFIHLESKNYSLLTYVNHMNREIEALEGVRQRRKGEEAARNERDCQWELAREQSVGVAQRQLEAKESVIAMNKEACAGHSDLLRQLKPLLQTTCRRIQEEFDGIKKAAGPFHNDLLQRLPAEIVDEGVPEALEWIERGLGRFRELFRGVDREQVFPVTARNRVVQLPAKRLNAPPLPLVNKNELPLCLLSDELPVQKRANISAAQKADILDEEAEEEDFGDRPLSIKDIRERAEKAIARRRKGQRLHSEPPHNAPQAPGSVGIAASHSLANTGGGDDRDRSSPVVTCRSPEMDEGHSHGRSSPGFHLDLDGSG